MYTICQIKEPSDLHQLVISLAYETKSMMYEVDEVPTEKYFSTMLQRLKDPNQGIALGSYAEKKLVGFISLERGKFKRNCGAGHLVMGILKEWSGRGIGYTLMTSAIKWAEEHKMYRLAFDVQSSNVRAINLYRRLGFETEGTLRNAVCIDGQIIDKYQMSILL